MTLAIRLARPAADAFRISFGVSTFVMTRQAQADIPRTCRELLDGGQLANSNPRASQLKLLCYADQ